jgi:hypothetical protein
MQMNEAILRVKEFDWKKHQARIKELIQNKPILVGVGVLAVLLLVNLLSFRGSSENRVVERAASLSFQDGRILNDRESTYYYGKERLLSQKAQSMLDGQTKLEARLAELEKKLQEAKVQPSTPANPDAGQTALPQTDVIGVAGWASKPVGWTPNKTRSKRKRT